MYKTYIDVVHVQKDEASSLFSMFADESQSEGAGAGEGLSQGECNVADAPDTQARGGGGVGRTVGEGGWGAAWARKATASVLTGLRHPVRPSPPPRPCQQDPGALLHTSNMTREEMEAKRAAFRVRCDASLVCPGAM